MKAHIDSEELCIEAAKEVIAASQQEFWNLLDLDWEGTVNVWIDKFIAENYDIVDPQLQVILDECIGVELERVEYREVG